MKKQTTPCDTGGDKVVLPHLGDQVAVSAALDKSLEGSALWVVLGIYRTFNVLDRDQAEEVAAMGLKPLQFNILTVLQRTGRATTMGALASMLVVKPTNLSGNINNLVERGLVRRELNAFDQRSLLAMLTDAGRAFLAEHLPAHWRRMERLMYRLPRERRLQLVALMKDLVLSIEDERHRERVARNSEHKLRTV